MRDRFANPMLEDPFHVVLPERPYPGLRPFYSSEWPIFFGRETMTDEIIDLVTKKHVVLVHGDSGSGKSSVVRAGVLVQLQQGHFASDESWQTCAMLPREDPLTNLARALAGLQDETPDYDEVLEIRHVLNRGKRAGAELAILLRQDKAHHICILVDQFEELFRFAREVSQSEAQIFVDVITGVAAEKTPGLYVVLTMRSEYLGSCARYRGLAEAVNSAHYLLPRMDRTALRRAIQEPAKLYGAEVTSRLADALIDDVEEDSDELPLIQHGLMQLWQRTAQQRKVETRRFGGLQESVVTYRAGPERRLDLDDLETNKGLKQLLSDHADSIHNSLTTSAREAAEYVFRALTDINAEGQAIRRPLLFAQLIRETGAREHDVRVVLDAFRADNANFIAPVGNAPIENDTFIDIGHEAVIRGWKKISDIKDGWLWKEINDGLAWRSLRFQAQKYKEHRRDRPSLASLIDRANWIGTLASPYWCDRHGGGQIVVARLFDVLTTSNHSNVFVTIVLSLLLLSLLYSVLTDGEYAFAAIIAAALLTVFSRSIPRFLRGQKAMSTVERVFCSYSTTSPVRSAINAESSTWTGSR